MRAPLPQDTLALRPPDVVMRLDRLGSAHQTRLSFLRALLRRMRDEEWRVARRVFDIDERGVGTAIYTVEMKGRVLSLVAFGHELAPEKRTDRVIAEAWDATFVLFDGLPTPEDVARLKANVPKQEAGRYLATELVLARANRSVRLFDHVLDALAKGRQPDWAQVEAIGYLMRTTAVYGNGKFGIADRDKIKNRLELAAPFRAEMLTVYLIRLFTVDLIEHLAQLRGGAKAVPLDRSLRRLFGIGNATGLGMAPFLVKHPALIDRWITARETALARVRELPHASEGAVAIFRTVLQGSRRCLAAWTTSDEVQARRIFELRDDLARLESFATERVLAALRPWDLIWRFAEENLTLEGQEYALTLLIEPHGDLVDDLADTMAIDEAASFRIDGKMSCDELKRIIARDYAWALQLDFSQSRSIARFWYVSEEKLEPRLGERFEEPGMEREQPLDIAREVVALAAALGREERGVSVAAFLLVHPEHRHAVRRIGIAARHPYSEIRDNLIEARMRPIDLLRCKLAFFGATRFDPRSDRWLRITLFQGAPYPDELAAESAEQWIYGG
ncbi:MAG: hypothetical protein JO068_02705 [Hyphomicrobiales bacterium]|nr:hypothetical protein [Hyphomicrobiales bacterium]